MTNKKYLYIFGCVFAFFVIANMYYKNAVLSQQIEQSKKVYIFNMEDALIRLGAVSLKQNFEKEVFALNDELKENEKKIERIKNANVKDDFSAVFLLKRGGDCLNVMQQIFLGWDYSVANDNNLTCLLNRFDNLCVIERND